MGAPIKWVRRKDGHLYPQRMILGIYQPEPNQAEIRQRAAAIRRRAAAEKARLALAAEEVAHENELRTRMVGIPEIAKLAGCSESTARRWLAERRIYNTDGESAQMNYVESFLRSTRTCS